MASEAKTRTRLTVDVVKQGLSASDFEITAEEAQEIVKTLTSNRVTTVEGLQKLSEQALKDWLGNLGPLVFAAFRPSPSGTQCLIVLLCFSPSPCVCP